MCVGITLIDMYTNCRKEAHKKFDDLQNQNVESSMVMLAGYAQQWLCVSAIHFEKMLLKGFNPNTINFLSTLKAFGNIGAIEEGKCIHDCIIRNGLESDVVVVSALVNMYVNCGNMELARKVFDKSSNRNVVVWGAIIAGYAQHGHGVLAIELFKKMQEEGIQPDKVMFSCILKASGSIGAIRFGKLIHEQIIENGLEPDDVIGSSLIDMYCKCGKLVEAREVFNDLSSRNVVSWGAMIAGYAQYGLGLDALELYEKMQEEETKPDRVTFLCLLKACATIAAMKQGKLIHDQIVKCRLESDVVIGSTLVDMYAKCGGLKEAQNVFDGLMKRNVVSWNAMMAGYVQFGLGFLALDLFEKMPQEGVEPAKITFMCVLKACGSIGASVQGKMIHNQLLMKTVELDLAIGNTLIDMYAKCGNLDEARRVFDELPNRDDTTWGAMIAGYVENGCGQLALGLFKGMCQHQLEPDKVLLSSILKACGCTGAIEQGMLIHNHIKKNGYETDVVIGNTLIDMYAKCGNLAEAQKVFDMLSNRTVVSWTAIIAAYSQHGLALPALELFYKMQKDGLKVENITFSTILKACSDIQTMQQGKQIHDQIICCGIETDTIVANSLVDMYVKCGSHEDAHKVFDTLTYQDIVSWSTIIAGYAQDGHGLPAMDLFIKMQKKGMKPDRVLYLCALKACGSIGAIELGELLHDQVIRNGFELDLSIGNTLVDMYAKCGGLEESCEVFDNLMNRNVVSWNAMIAGYAQHGFCKLARQCFEDMRGQDLKPDGCTYTGILTACSQAALVKEGYGHFKIMKEIDGIIPSIEHFNCMVDLLGRAGCLYEANRLLQTMPVFPDITGWMSLLTACRTYGNMELARKCFDEIILLNHDTAAVYVFMSSMYADFDMWENVDKVEEIKKCTSAWKKPGRAWIETTNMVHEFIVGDRSHLQIGRITIKLQKVARQIKVGGYVPKLEFMFETTLNGGNENVLW